MSTKIYDGLIALEKDPFKVAVQLRGVLEPLVKESYKAYVQAALAAEEGTSWKQALIFHDDSEPIPTAGYLVEDYVYKKLVALHETSSHTFSTADILYELFLLPNGVPDGPPLVMVFGEQARRYRELLIEAGVVRPYGYWNNSDEEEGVTPEEWRERELAWSVLDDASPAEVGLAIPYPSSLAMKLHLYGH